MTNTNFFEVRKVTPFGSQIPTKLLPIVQPIKTPIACKLLKRKGLTRTENKGKIAAD